MSAGPDGNGCYITQPPSRETDSRLSKAARPSRIGREAPLSICRVRDPFVKKAEEKAPTKAVRIERKRAWHVGEYENFPPDLT